MDTILNVASAYLDKNGATSFDELFKVVEGKLGAQWEERNPKKSAKDLKATKMTEFYTLLTISGPFVRTQDGKFGLVESFTYKEVQTMKVNVGELD